MLNFVQHIVVIGLGGIGTWFVTPFARFLHEQRFGGELVMADGDTFSALNAHRQDMEATDLGKHKAAALAERLSRTMPGLHIRTFTEYVTADNAAQVVKEKSLAIVAVDNHPARATVARHAASLNDVCVLSAGNEKYDGNVHVYLRRAGKDLCTSLLERHPEIAKSRSGDRATLGCDELITLGQPQLLVTNFLAATALLVAFHALWDRDALRRSRVNRPSGLPQEIFFDVRAQAMTAIATPIQHEVPLPVPAAIAN
ncbi:MAG: ThiF family adenylyltransferase [Planctomycetota bacterium]